VRQKPEISAVLVGHLTRMQTLPSFIARSELFLRDFLKVPRTLILKYSTFHCFYVLYKKNYCIKEQVRLYDRAVIYSPNSCHGDEGPPESFSNTFNKIGWKFFRVIL